MFSKIFTTVKYCLVSVNLLFVITGIIVLSVGISVQSSYNNYNALLSSKFFSLPAFCIATGIIIFLIASAGFYGAITENYWVNMGYAGAMVLIFVFQLSACIAGYVLRGNTIALVQAELTDTMRLYGTANPVVTRLWDEVQQDFECCGVTNSSDWLAIVHNGTITTGLPISCCSQAPGIIHTFTCDATNAFTSGCAEGFGAWVQSHAASIGVAGVFLVLMQALAVGGAVWIARMASQDTYMP